MKHKITINVADADERRTTMLKGAGKKLPTRILRFLFGDFTQVYFLSTGQTVQSVDINKVKKKKKK